MPTFPCRVVAVLVVCVAFLLAPFPASAQDPGRVGLTMSFPASVGVLVPVTESVSIRPEFSFRRNTFDLTSSGQFDQLDASADGWQYDAGISAWFYLGRWDRLRTYVSPSYSYSKTSAIGGDVLTVGDGEASTHGVMGSFGSQYLLGERFGMFGQIGLEYARTQTSSHFGVEVTIREVATRGAVGVVLFF